MGIVKDLQLQTELRREMRPGSRHGARWFVPLVMLAISGYLYLNLFLVPNVPILLSGDQVYFWMNGQRMLHGERPYLDFFRFTPPGTDVFYFALFKVFGPRIWALNVAVLGLGVMLCWVCFIIAERIMERHLALLATLLFLTLVYSRLLNATHHYFSVLAVMAATAILMRGSSYPRIAVGGALLGMASFFTQTHGVAALLAVTFLIAWEQRQSGGLWRIFWRKEAILLSGFTITLLSLSAPFITSAGLKQLWYFQVTYVRRAMVHAPETHLLGMPQYSNWRALTLLFLVGEYSRHVFVYAMLPTIYLIVLMRCRRRLLSSGLYSRGVALLGLVGSSLLGELIFSLNWLRLYAVSMAGIILFIWVIATTPKLRHYGVVVIWAIVACLGLLQPWFTQHREYITAELPAGRSAVEPHESAKLSWGMQHTNPGEFLFQASWPGMYIPLGLRNPVFLDTASTMLNPQWAERAVQQLQAKHVQYIIWAARLNYPVDPHLPRTASIVPLRTYLNTCYRLEQVFDDGDEVWERR